MIRLVPPQLLSEPTDGGVGVDQHQLGAGQSPPDRPGARRSGRWTAPCGAVRLPSARPRWTSGDREPVARPRGRRAAWAVVRPAAPRRRRWRRGGTARPGRRCRAPPPRPGAASNTRRTGSSRSPMPSGWISQGGSPLGDARADLEHVRAEDLLLAGHQVVRVVLHEGGAAGQAVGDHLEGAQHDRRLPVALAAEAVAVGHQPLDRQAGELTQAAEVLEVRGERREAAVRRGRCAARPRCGRRSAATRGARRPAGARGRRRRGRRTPGRACRPRRRRPASTTATRSLTPQVLTETPKRRSASTLSPSVTATLRMLSPNRASRIVLMAARPRAARAQTPTRRATSGSPRGR